MAMKLSTVLGVFGATALAVIKETRGRDLIVMNQNYVISQVVCFGVMLLVLVAVFAAWLGRIVESRRRGMIWSVRRKKAVQVWQPCPCDTMPEPAIVIHAVLCSTGQPAAEWRQGPARQNNTAMCRRPRAAAESSS